MPVSTLLPVTLAVVFRTQLAPCSELPPAPPDPTAYPTTERGEAGKGLGGARVPPQVQEGFYVPPYWPPNWALGFHDRGWGGGAAGPQPDEVGRGGRHPFPVFTEYDTVFTEYDYYADEVGKGDPFLRLAAERLEQCKVPGDLLRHTPWLKVALRGCELARGALALNAKTIELQLSGCRSPLTAATFTPWVFQEEALDAGLQQGQQAFERHLVPLVGSFLPLDDKDAHRGRYLKIDNCPLANDPDLFPAIWHSLCDFTLYDPRPEFDGLMSSMGSWGTWGRIHGKGPGEGQGGRHCHGPFGGAAASTLVLANVELSVGQLEAVVGAMLPDQLLTLSRVSLTGPPSVALLAAFQGKVVHPPFVKYAEARDWGLHIVSRGGGGPWYKFHEWIWGERATKVMDASTAEGFEKFRACVRGAAPDCTLTEEKEAELVGAGKTYVPWLSQSRQHRMPNEPVEEPRAEYTFGVTVRFYSPGDGPQ